MGTLQSGSASLAVCHVSSLVLEQFVLCGGIYCPAEGGICYKAVLLPTRDVHELGDVIQNNVLMNRLQAPNKINECNLLQI